MKCERRTMYATRLTVERRAEGEPAHIVGHAAVFDSLSEELWGFREKIARGAFSKAIVNDDVRALWNHDPNFVLGRNKSGTLLLEEDDVGLRMDITPPNTAWARDLLVSIERGDVSGASFAFSAVGEKWERVDGVIVRTVTEARLYDVAPVTYPAYPETDVGVRSLVVSEETIARARAEAFRNGASLDLLERELDLLTLEL